MEGATAQRNGQFSGPPVLGSIEFRRHNSLPLLSPDNRIVATTIRRQPTRGCRSTQASCQCMDMWAMCESRVRLLTFSPLPSSRPSLYTMTTLDSLVAGDTPSTVAHHPTITPMLNTDIETFAAFKDTLKAAPVRAIFESIIVILTLVRVGFLALFPLLHSLIGNMARAR